MMANFRWAGRIEAHAQIALVVCLMVVVAQFVSLNYALRESQSAMREIAHDHTTAIATIDRFDEDLTTLSYRILGVVGGIYAAPNIAHEIPRLGVSIVRNFQHVRDELRAFVDPEITERAERVIGLLPPFLSRTEQMFLRIDPAPSEAERRRLEIHHDEWLDIHPALTLFADAVRTRVKENAALRFQELEAMELRLTRIGGASLVAAMRRIATGDTTATVPNVADATELGDMARAVQVFKDKSIENRRLQAEEARQRAELARARDEAEAANRTKSEFLANMSHELRTPLNAVIGFSDVMANEMFGPLGSPKYKGYVEDMRASGHHLLQIINDILDISKVEAGKLELREEPVDVREIIGACERLVGERARAANVRLRVAADPAMPPLKADLVRMKQIVLNLLSNAVKFTPSGGAVEIGARLDGGCVAIEIRDTGIGMTPDEVRLALQPFRQIDSKLARKYEGTGLGLPLTKALVELHGGEMRIRSRPGAGTTVTVTLPAFRTVMPAAPEGAWSPGRHKLAGGAAA